MTESQKFEAALDGYVVMTQALLADWVPYLDALSAKAASPSYGPGAVTAEFPAFAKLVADSLVRVVAEAGDALATITSSYDQTVVVPLVLDPEIADVAEVLKLSVKGDFTCVTGSVLPKERITLVPDELVPPRVDFDLSADGTGMDPRIYRGFVVLTDPAGKVVGEQRASVTIA